MIRILLALLFISSSAGAQEAVRLSRPELDFEKFWRSFKDNYAFFELKGVNWDSTYARFRPRVKENTSKEELVSILGQMVDPLKDGHITLSEDDDILYKSPRASRFREEFKGLEKEFWRMVDTTLMDKGFFKPVGVGPAFKEERLYYFARTKDVAYIRITRCFARPESLFEEAEEKADLRLMLRLFDSLLQKASGTGTLIVDLRSNGGGHGGFELASRLVRAKTLTHYKAVKRKGSKASFAEAKPQYILPHKGARYSKQVILLTSDRTASSAEDFAISLYTQPHVTTVGTHTSGMLSDMFEGTLSNNLSFTLSNQVYYSKDKTVMEDKGVPVQYEVVNTKENIREKKDPVIVKAMQLANGRREKR